MKKSFIQQLKKESPTLYEIYSFIVSSKELGWGEIQFTVKTHNYTNKFVEMKAVKPTKKTMMESVTKRIMVDTSKKK